MTRWQHPGVVGGEAHAPRGCGGDADTPASQPEGVPEITGHMIMLNDDGGGI